MEQSQIDLKRLGAQEKQVEQIDPKITHRVDLVYKQELTSGLQLRMDLLIPETNALHPAILFLPGGGFTTADYHKTLPLRLYLAQAGYVVASAAYRPIPEQFPTLLHDAKAALAFLHEQAESLAIDRKKIVVMGDSAGGYLTQMLWATANTDQLLPETIPVAFTDLAVAVSLYGFSNLLTMTNTTQFQPENMFSNQDKLSPEKILLKGASADKSETYDATQLYELAKCASPIHYVHPKSRFKPLLLLHGNHDQLVPSEQSTQMYTAVKSTQTDVEYWIINDADHGSVEFSQRSLFKDISEWLTKRLEE